jgi:YidC/Oxa1 family membrane protein insertase
MSPSPNAPDTKNLALAIALSLVILLGFQYFYEMPRAKARAAQESAQKAAAVVAGKANPAGVTANPAAVPGTGAPVARPQALALTQRISLDNSGIDGSISTLGARFDDVRLKRYKDTIKPNSPEVTLLHPQGTADGYYAFFGYKAPEGSPGLLPGPNTVWSAPAGAKLTPKTPVTLTYDNGQGLKFARTIALDDNYLFTITDVVTNTGAAPITLQSYGAIRRHSKPKDLVNARH